jgi:hypothetical protein
LIAANISIKQRNKKPEPESIIPVTVFDPPAPSVFQTPDIGVINIPKEFPDVLNSQYSYPQPEEKKVVTETPKPKETWSEILYRRAGLTRK